MRATNGKNVRKYVYDVRLGDEKAVALYRGDKKLWPTLSDTVYSIVLDVAEHEGTLAWAYWLHALAAVANGASAECYIKLTVGGRDYMLGSMFGRWHLVEFDGRATVVFGDNGPLMEKVAEGDEVQVEMEIPEHSGASASARENGAAEAMTWLPWLPGSRLQVRVNKGRKKVSAGCRFSVVGEPSGTVHINGYAQKNGHCRGTYYGVAYAREGRVINGAMRLWSDAFVVGDSSMKVSGDWYNFGSGSVQPVFPGFKKSIKFKVSSVIRHD